MTDAKKPKYEAPKGFRTVVTAELPAAWDFVKMPNLSGVVVLMQEVEITDKKGTRLAKVAHVDTGKEILGLWESATLKPLFHRMAEGSTITVDFVGLGIKKPGQDAPKLFNAAIQE
jgi:hypothetical protein